LWQEPRAAGSDDDPSFLPILRLGHAAADRQGQAARSKAKVHGGGAGAAPEARRLTMALVDRIRIFKQTAGGEIEE
jgi:hypothetical protein